MSESPRIDGVFRDHGPTSLPQSGKITQYVAVPSSRHVAEIVGKKGQRIQALRARTNTYIKTPALGEDPVFVISGRLEDVAEAKREIVSDAHHVTKTNAARRNNILQITRYVSVPSSDHVAKIVGKNSSRIKALRKMINTSAYIKIPERGKPPIFVITGWPKEVVAAKSRLLDMADNFTKILEQNNAMQNQNTQSLQSLEKELITVDVLVPQGRVGAVVGPKAVTINRIQKLTNTFIITPSRFQQPCFKVTGKPEDTERARRAIEKCIAMRTGVFVTDSNSGDLEKVAPSRPLQPPPTATENTESARRETEKCIPMRTGVSATDSDCGDLEMVAPSRPLQPLLTATEDTESARRETERCIAMPTGVSATESDCGDFENVAQSDPLQPPPAAAGEERGRLPPSQGSPFWDVYRMLRAINMTQLIPPTSPPPTIVQQPHRPNDSQGV